MEGLLVYTYASMDAQPKDFQLYSVKPDGALQKQLTAFDEDLTKNGAPYYNAQPDISPEGHQIAFVSSRNGHPNIYVMDMISSDQVRMRGGDPTIDYDDMHPDWSPDGNIIAFTRMWDDRNKSNIFVMGATRSGYQLHFESDTYDYDPDWSPDGMQIAFASQETASSNSSIWIMNADGAGRKKLVLGSPLYSYSSPKWSPDGRYIAFYFLDKFSDAGLIKYVYLPTMEVFEIPQTEGALYPVDHGAAWSPDGKCIAFTRGYGIVIYNLDTKKITPLHIKGTDISWGVSK